MNRIRLEKSRELVEDFLDSGERLWVRFKNLRKRCGDYMWEAAKKANGDKEPMSMGKDSSCHFVEFTFGREHELDKTEKLKAAIHLRSMRFDANCDSILRNPAGNNATAQDSTPCNEDTAAPQSTPSDTSDEVCEDAHGKAISSADQTVISLKRKLEDL